MTVLNTRITYLLTYIYYSLFTAGYLSTAVGISATFNTDHI